MITLWSLCGIFMDPKLWSDGISYRRISDVSKSLLQYTLRTGLLHLGLCRSEKASKKKLVYLFKALQNSAQWRLGHVRLEKEIKHFEI